MSVALPLRLKCLLVRLQFSDSSFDVVVDKGGLDAILGEPEDESTAGVALLSEVSDES